VLAAIYKGKKNIKVRDIPKPEIDDNEVLLKVKACSICGTDRKIYEYGHCLLYTSPSPRDRTRSRMPSSA